MCYLLKTEKQIVLRVSLHLFENHVFHISTEVSEKCVHLRRSTSKALLSENHTNHICPIGLLWSQMVHGLRKSRPKREKLGMKPPII